MTRGQGAGVRKLRAGNKQGGLHSLLAAGMVALLFGAASMFAGTLQSEAADGVRRLIASDGADVQRVVITVNKSRTLRMEQAFGTAMVGSSEIADALPMSDRVLYIQAKRIGTTNISVFDPNARLIGIIDVEVVSDIANLQQKIRASLGSSGIRVSSAGGQIVLTGMAVNAVAADRAVQVAKSLAGGDVVNAMEVAPTQQVLLEVRFLEASRAAGRELGVNLFAGGGRLGERGFNTGLGTVTGAGRTSQTTTTTTTTTINPLTGQPTTTSTSAPAQALNPGGLPVFETVGTLLGGSSPYVTILTNLLRTANGSSIDLLITALEEKGVVRRLAEPNLMALSGDRARFLAGGEFPVPIAQTSGAVGSAATITVEWKRFGVELNFAPTVLSRGIINLRVEPSVSELDFAQAVQISGFLIPALTKRDAATVVELRDGQSFAIAGLLSSVSQRNIQQVPWLGSVPVLGALFSSKQYQQSETDLVIIVTPRLVSPAAPGQRLASPLDSRLPSNDVDFFLNGQPEVKKRYTDFISSGGGLSGPYGHLIEPDAGIVGPLKKR